MSHALEPVSHAMSCLQAGFPSTVGIDRHQAHLPASLLGDVGEELGGVDVEVPAARTCGRNGPVLFA